MLFMLFICNKLVLYIFLSRLDHLSIKMCTSQKSKLGLNLDFKSLGNLFSGPKKKLFFVNCVFNTLKLQKETFSA